MSKYRLNEEAKDIFMKFSLSIIFLLFAFNANAAQWDLENYPTFPPMQPLQSVTAIPDQAGVAIEMEGKKDFRIKIINLSDGEAKEWRLPSGISNTVVHQDSLENWASISWAAKANQLLLNRGGEIDLLGKDGSFSVLHLHMPGKLAPYNGVHDYAISPDGKQVAFSIYTRDIKDRQADGFGKLYKDLFYQNVDGSEPIKLASGTDHFLPDWNRDGTKIAFTTHTGSIVIADLNTQKMISIEPPVKPFLLNGSINMQEITEIRWSPDGTKLAFILKSNLYFIDFNDSAPKAFKANQDNVAVQSFAWSPDGNQFLFRSSYGAEGKCSFNIFHKLEVGKFPCLQSYYLYKSNIDGSKLKRINDNTDYRIGELFWIQ